MFSFFDFSLLGTDDEKLDNDLRLYAVNSYLDLIAKPAVPDILLQLMCWVCLGTHFTKF